MSVVYKLLAELKLKDLILKQKNSPLKPFVLKTTKDRPALKTHKELLKICLTVNTQRLPIYKITKENMTRIKTSRKKW